MYGVVYNPNGSASVSPNLQASKRVQSPTDYGHVICVCVGGACCDV